MKNIIKILLSALICLATTCHPREGENCHYSIKFSNNSEKNLRVNSIHLSVLHPDPLDIKKQLSYTAIGKWYKVESGVQDNRSAIAGSFCIEDNFKNESFLDTISVYVFDAELIENIEWEVVARDYLVLKRYDLSWSDLKRLDWRITYPPTEAMKDVKQYPPYGE